MRRFKFVATYDPSIKEDQCRVGEHQTLEWTREFRDMKEAMSYASSCLSVLSQASLEELEEFTVYDLGRI